MQGGVVAALLLSSALFIIAFGIKALTLQGGIAMWLMGFWIYRSLGWQGFLIPVIFLVLGSLFTKLGYEKKKERGIAEKRGGERGVKEVLANGLVPVIFTIPIVLGHSTLFKLGYVGAWATALGDTSSTELGGLWGKRAFLIQNLKRVSPGTQGAISLEGTIAGFCAALVIAAVACAVGLVPAALALPIGCAALCGGLAESYLGEIISPAQRLKHELLNFANTAIGGLFALLWGGLIMKP